MKSKSELIIEKLKGSKYAYEDAERVAKELDTTIKYIKHVVKSHDPSISWQRSKTKAMLVKEYFEDNPNATCEEIANRFKTSTKYVRQILGTSVSKRNDNLKKEQKAWKESEDSAQFSYVGNEKISTLEEALKFSEVDMSIWKVDHFTIKHNAWDVHFKGEGITETTTSEDGKSTTSKTKWDAKKATNTQVSIKIFFKRKKLEFLIEKVIEESVEQIKSHAPIYKIIERPKKRKDSYMALVSFVDGHTGKFAVKEEVGERNDIKTSILIRDWAVDEVIERIKHKPLHRIVYLVGGDDVNVDNKRSTTTRGTYVESDGKWWQAFEAVKQSHIRSIEKLRLLAPVKLIHTFGNHDFHLSYFLASVLDAWFKNCKDIDTSYSTEPQKYLLDGNTLLGFTHGRYENFANLPLIMATDVPELWSKATCREWITGDKHHKKSIKYVGSEDMQSIIVRRLPTLSGTDFWLKSKGYKSVRAAETYYYHKEFGLSGYEHIPLRSMPGWEDI